MMNFEKQPPHQLDAVSERILAQKPMHFACYTGDGHLLDTLIGRAFLHNNKDDGLSSVASLISEEDALNGWTPAHWAAFFGQLSCLMKLHIKPGLGFDTPSHRSNTSPLHLAAQSGAVLCLKWLLQCGSSQNRQDFMGETALHKAAKSGNMDCVAILIGHGASLHLKNHRGLTPADVAEELNHMALAQYIRRAMEQAEYGGTTNCNTQSSPPISDLTLRSEVTTKPASSTPFYSAHPTFPDMAFVSREAQERQCSYIEMNGETIHNSDQGKTMGHDSTCADQETMDMEDVESATQNNTNTTHMRHMLSTNNNMKNDMAAANQAESVFFFQASSGMKRSFNDAEDDSEWHHQKRRCFVAASEKSPADRYGDAYNNNIISSYNAVLAMRVEPMGQSIVTDSPMMRNKAASPVLPQSSVLDHQASLAAQQGYESTFMNSLTSAFH